MLSNVRSIFGPIFNDFSIVIVATIMVYIRFMIIYHIINGIQVSTYQKGDIINEKN